jgi:hypothetical protein
MTFEKRTTSLRGAATVAVAAVKSPMDFAANQVGEDCVSSDEAFDYNGMEAGGDRCGT